MYPIKYLLTLSFDYKVVNIIHKVIIQHNMKLNFLRLNAASKPSPIFEGVVEIRINSQPYKGNNLTT
jgi:hypothetical protein